MKFSQDLINAIIENNSFLTHVHLGPDADSISSVLSLKLALESIGKVVNVVSEDSLMSGAEFLEGFSKIDVVGFEDALNKYEFDTYISLDTALERLITYFKPFPEISTPIINIDHHPDNSIKANFSHIDPEAASTTEILFDLYKELKIKITPEIATCLLFGLMGDTGVFQNYNTTSKALLLAAELKSLGANYNLCLVNAMKNEDINTYQTWIPLLKNLKISEGKTYTYTTLSYDEYKRSDSNIQIGAFANQIISKIAPTKFGVVLAEKEQGVTKGSFRSRDPEFDVSEIAHRFGGGGHKAAAAFRIEEPLDVVKKEFFKITSEMKLK